VVRHKRKQVKPWHIAGAMDFRDALAAGRPHTMTPVALKPEDLAFLQYTGGTTGVSKGAMLTHRNIIANFLQILECLKTLLAEGEELATCALPLYHIFSLTVNAFGLFAYGVTNLMITNPRDIPTFIKTLRSQRV